MDARIVFPLNYDSTYSSVCAAITERRRLEGGWEQEQSVVLILT